MLRGGQFMLRLWTAPIPRKSPACHPEASNAWAVAVYRAECTPEMQAIGHDRYENVAADRSGGTYALIVCGDTGIDIACHVQMVVVDVDDFNRIFVGERVWNWPADAGQF